MRATAAVVDLEHGDRTAEPGRLLFEYDHNTNNLGRTAGGLPTPLADDAWTVRGEVVF